MKFKRFSDDCQRILEQAYAHGMYYALVSKRDFSAYHGLYGVACCTTHLVDEDGEYKIVYIPDLKGFNK